MLGFRKTKSDAVSGFLGSQTEFTGKLAFSGVVHLDGVFHGEIISRGTLVVGGESVVHATIHSAVLKIAGEVRGDLVATEKIELYPPAKIYGNIRTPRLVIEEGVIFEGTCSMAAVKADLTEFTEFTESTSEQPGEEEPLEAITAQAWPPSYEESEGLEPENSDKAPLHKHDR